MNATLENMFIVPRSQIITMVELDKRIAGYYEDHLNNKLKYKKSRIEEPKNNSNRQNLENSEGYLGSIKEAKKLLEEIYNKSWKRNTAIIYGFKSCVKPLYNNR